MNDILIYFLFFIVALVYSSAGFGGGSSYLAILSVVLVEFYEIRTLALLLNLTVVSLSTIMFIRSRVFSWKLFWPFIVTSIPLAFLGATLRLSEEVFFVLLGVALLLASAGMFTQTLTKTSKARKLSLVGKGGLGVFIGLFSGMTGIGGGIYLSPTLNLLRWESPRIVASLASFFILCNSLAGLTGLLISGTFQVQTDFALKIVATVLVGGLIGGYLTNRVIGNNAIRIVTAILIAIVGVRIILKALG